METFDRFTAATDLERSPLRIGVSPGNRCALAIEPDELGGDAAEQKALEEQLQEKRPKYITNYIGSKQKLVDWIWRNTPEKVSSVLDAFSGSAVWFLGSG